MPTAWRSKAAPRSSCGWPLPPFMYAVSILLGIGALVQAVVASNAIRRAALTRPPVEKANRASVTAIGWS